MCERVMWNRGLWWVSASCRWSSPLCPPGQRRSGWARDWWEQNRASSPWMSHPSLWTHTHTHQTQTQRGRTENTAVTQSVKITGWKILTCVQTLSLFSLCLVLRKCKSFCLTVARHMIQYFMAASLHSPFTLTTTACMKHGLGLCDVNAIDFK